MNNVASIIFPENFNESILQLEDGASFIKWICNTIEPYVLSPALEMDSGSGCVSTILAERGFRLSLSDKNESNRDVLRSRFVGVEQIGRVVNIDFCRTDFESCYSQIMGVFGAILCLNVMEKGFFHGAALLNARRLLRPRGRLIFIAPIVNAMFYDWNTDPESWNQYNRDSLKTFLKCDFEILKTRYLKLGSCMVDNYCTPLGLAVLAVIRQL